MSEEHKKKKKKFAINSLRKVEQIINKELYFLNYSTQKRNIAYQIQHLNFMRELYQNYKIYGATKGIFIQQVIILLHSMIEAILFLVLSENGSKLEKNISFQGLISRGKNIKPPILTKTLHKNLLKINKKRNLLHPERHKELHIKNFTLELLNEFISYYNDFTKQIKKYYENKK
jgi:hypothetical protein